MQEMGLEPTRYCYHRHLKPARLPIPPLLRTNDILSNVGENVNYFFFGCLCQVFVGTFFVFRNSVEKFCVSWAFPLIECVAVWALKPPVPHTDVLKTHSSQSFSTELLEYKGTGSEHLSQTNPSKLSFSLSYNRIPKYLSGCGCCCIFPSHHSPLSL